MTSSHTAALLAWLREVLAKYVVEPVAIYRPGVNQDFPLRAKDEADLQTKLAYGGHFLPLPKGPQLLPTSSRSPLPTFLSVASRAFPMP
jgi:hypothetical protein